MTDRRRMALLIGLAVGLLGRPGRSQEAQFFRLSSISGALLSAFDLTREKSLYTGIVYQDSLRKFVQGGVQVQAEGSLYHPNFLSFQISLNLVDLYSKRKYFSDAATSNALNNTYDVNLTLFSKKPLSLDIYSRRNFATADRAFLERYFVTFQSTGLRLNSRLKSLPFQLDAYKTKNLSESKIFRERQEKTGNVDFHVTPVNTVRDRSDLTVRWKDYGEAVYGVKFQSLDVLADYLQSFGKDNRNRVSYLFNFNRMRGDFRLDRAQFRVGELYALSKSLATGGATTMVWDNSFGQSSLRMFLYRTLDYQLFESLTASLQAGGRFEKSTFQKIVGGHGQLSVGYQKKIPGGMIQLNYSGRLEDARFSSQSGVIQAAETFRFSVNDTINIHMPSVNPATVRVTTIDLSYVYLEGLDYRVNVIGAEVVVTRLPGGGIPSEAEVLVYFDYLSFPDFRLSARFQQSQARLTFLSYLQVFFLRSSNQYRVRSAYVIPPFENYQRTSYGAGVVSRPLRAEYSLEEYRSNLTEYRAKNLMASANFRPIRPLSFSAYFSGRVIDYVPRIFSSRFQSANVEGSLILGAGLMMNAAYRKIRYVTNFYFRDSESLYVKLQWSFRKMILNVFYEHILHAYENSHLLRDYFTISLRRLF